MKLWILREQRRQPQSRKFQLEPFPEESEILFCEILYCLRMHEGNYWELFWRDFLIFFKLHRRLQDQEHFFLKMFQRLLTFQPVKHLQTEERWKALVHSEAERKKGRLFYQTEANCKLYPAHPPSPTARDCLLFSKQTLSEEELQNFFLATVESHLKEMLPNFSLQKLLKTYNKPKPIQLEIQQNSKGQWQVQS